MARSSPKNKPIIEKYDDSDENIVELAEADAIKEEKFSNPEWLGDPQADPGITDEESIYAETLEEGAGANIHPEEVQELGTHIEEVRSKSRRKK